METIGTKTRELEGILEKVFPELSVDIVQVPDGEGSTLPLDEISKALQYIKESELVQDSRNLLGGTTPMRTSVSYPINFPDQERELYFKVEWSRGPSVFVGYINTPHLLGDLKRARLYGMRLK